MNRKDVRPEYRHRACIRCSDDGYSWRCARLVKLLVFLSLLVICWSALGQQTSPPDTKPQSQGADATAPAPQPQSTPPQAPAAGTGAANTKQDDSHCENPADPHRRHHGCEDQVFGLDETLAGGWGGV